MISPGGRVYYGWVLVGGLAVTETISYGVLCYAYAVLMGPMQAESGWSRTQVTGAYSAGLAVSALAAVPVGRWLDRHGARGVMTAGSIGATALCLAWARTTTLAGLYLTWAALGLCMAAVLYEPAFAVLAVWFRQARSRALTLLTAVAGFASVLFLPLAAWLTAAWGWRIAVAVLGLVLGLGTIPIHALLLRRRPEDHGLHPDGAASAPLTARSQPPGRRSPDDRRLHWLTLAFTLANFAAPAIAVHLVAILTEGGHGSSFAAAAAAAVGVMALPGRVLFTPLGDRVSRARLTALLMALQALALLVLFAGHGSLAAFGFVALFGLGNGAIAPARAALVADLYGPQQYGEINGTVALFVVASRALGPVAAGVLHDLAGSYGAVLLTLSAVCATGAAALLQVETAPAPPTRATRVAPGGST